MPRGQFEATSYFVFDLMHSKGPYCMSWRVQNRSEDANTPSVARAMSENPELVVVRSSHTKAGFAKIVDASAAMGANLALARWKKEIGCRCRPTRRFSFNLAYDGLLFNGLLFIYGARLKSEETH